MQIFMKEPPAAYIVGGLVAVVVVAYLTIVCFGLII